MKIKWNFIFLAVCLVMAFTLQSAWGFSKGINCGGMPYVASDGKKFAADIEYQENLKSGYIGGNKGSTDYNIYNTEDPDLFKTDRWGFTEYRFDVPVGVYKVSLYIAETHFEGQGERVFDIYIGDKLVKKDLDIISEYGKNKAAIISFITKVTDGKLVIRAEASADQPKLCAVYIEDIAKDNQPPQAPEIQELIPHDSAAGFIWADSPDIDVAGYDIYRKISSDGENKFKKLNEKLINVPTYIDKGLENGTTYSYRLKTVDVFGNESEFSKSFEITPVKKTFNELILRLNCGGEAVNISKNCGFVADQEYNPAIGYGYKGGTELIGEAIDQFPIYASMREGFKEYIYDVPNGIYKVILCFAEPKYDREAKRLFDVYLENKLILDDLDVFKESHDCGFVVKEYITLIEDGQLNIRVDKRFSLPVMTYLAVVPFDADDTTPVEVENIRAESREDRVFVLWDESADNDIIGYNIYKSQKKNKGFKKINLNPVGLNYFRDNEVAIGDNYYYQVTALDVSLNESEPSETIKVDVKKLSDDEFLDMVEKAAFSFFWDEADQYTGLIKDRSDTHVVSTASVGFGLSAMIAGAERGYRDKAEIEERVFNILKTLNEGPKKFGLYFHYVDYDGEISKTGYEKAISTIDSGILLMGVVTAGEYFGGRIKEEAEKIIAGADWQSMVDKNRNMIFMAWVPNDQNNIEGNGQYHSTWDYYTDEAIICSLLGISAPNEDYRVAPDAFYKWRRSWGKYLPKTKGLVPGNDFVYSWSGCTFTYQFAHCWIDFSKLGKDQPKKLGLNCSAVDWHENTIEAMKTARLYCIDKAQQFKTFSQDSWGLTACASKNGYLVVGAMPKGDMHDDPGDGTMAPYGAGCALPFVPKESIAALRYYYNLKDANGQRLVWKDEYEGGFGFWDSFNLDNDYVANLVIGIDQGPLILSIENYRSGLIWKTFMQNKSIQQGLKRIGFEKLKK
jgi:hypothetical protein